MSSSSPRPYDLERLLVHADWLKGLAWALTRDPSEADDLEQETWLAALRHAPQRAEGDVRAWLASVARNLDRRRRRATSRRGDHERTAAASTESPESDDPAAIAERVAWQRELADRVLALPEPLRTAVALRYFEGLKPAEIARRLSITPENARQRVARGLASLREELDRSHGSRGAWCALVSPLSRSLPAPVRSTPPSSTRGPASASPTFLWKEWLAVKSAQRLAVVVALLLVGWVGWSAFHEDAVSRVASERVPALLAAPRGQPLEPSAATDRFALAADPQPASPPPSVSGPTGVLVFLVHPSGPAPAGSRWRLEAPEGQEASSLTIDVPEDGRVSVPAGSWTLSELGSTWSSATSRLNVSEDGEELVWVGGQQVIDVLVVDRLGHGIEGAHVDWVPWEPAWSPELANASTTSPRVALSARTDAEGRAVLRWQGIVQGTLRVHRTGRPFEQLGLCASQRDVVRVVLGSDEASETEILVVDARTGLARAGVELMNEATRTGVRTGDDGRARVYTSTPAQASWIVQGGGVFPMQVDPDGVSTLRVTDSARLALRLGTAADAGERASLSMRIVSVEPPVDGGPLLEAALREVQLPAELDVAVPLGGRIEVALVAARGRGAWREIDIDGATTELAMELHAEDPLRLVLTGPPQALARARIEARYSTFAAVPIEPDSATEPGDSSGPGRFTIPCGDHLQRLEILAPGCVPMQLMRSQAEVASGGQLEIALRPSEHALTVTFVDEEGLPVPGVQVRAADDIQLEWFRAYPQLYGSRPTSHAAWNLSVGRGLPRRVSAADGRVRLALPAPAKVRLEWTLASTNSWTDGFPLIEMDGRLVATPETRELLWVIPRARRVTLQAFDAADGAPIERFEVVDPEGATSVPGTGQGGIWQGWVPARGRWLAVRASLERTGEVALPPWDPAHPELTLRVDLGTSGTSTLVLEGPAAEELRGQSLRLCAEKVGKPPGHQGGVDWQTVLSVQDPSRIPVALPLRQAMVGVYLEGNGAQRYRFTPQRLSWRQGERNVFQVERR